MEDYYNHLRQKSEQLAGDADDLIQRAIVYHHLYNDSKGNHTFPLLAAHGALWGKRYLSYGDWFANAVSYKYSIIPGLRKKKLEQLEQFSSAFREINRKVCVEAYISYYLTKRYGEVEGVENFVPENVLKPLNECHRSVRTGEPMNGQDKKRLYNAFFLWEQDAVVGPKATDAESAFEWTCMKFFALRPVINFSYFPALHQMAFKNFTNGSERVQHGMRAFDIAEKTGWDKVEASLLKYKVLPKDYLSNLEKHHIELGNMVAG